MRKISYRKIIIYIILAFFFLGCNPDKIITNKEDFEGVHIDKYAERISRPELVSSHPEFIPTIEQVEVKVPLKEVITDEAPNEENSANNEEEQIRQMLKEKFNLWYRDNRNTIKYELSIMIFLIFCFILFVYWLVRLVNKLSPNKLGFTLICVTLMSLLLLGIMVYL